MNALFTKRRQLFQKQCAKYLKYVLNDHFILFLMLGVGFVMVQYSQLVKNPPEQPFLLMLFVVALLLVSGLMGDFNAYLEGPDQQFLLVKEADVAAEITKASRKGLLLWSLVHLILAVFLYPLARSIDFPELAYWGIVGLGLVLKFFRMGYRLKRLSDKGHVFWQEAIWHDRNQKQSVLKFFSLFTQVKGISQAVKRRRYLDPILSFFNQGTWQYLFARAFLRSGDYLSLTVRLVVLACLSLAFIGQDLVATALTLLFNYLLLFQLMALFNHYDYQYMTGLFPVAKMEKKKGLLRFLNRLFLLILTAQLVIAAVFFTEKTYLAVLVGVQLLLNLFYLPYKIEKLID